MAGVRVSSLPNKQPLRASLVVCLTDNRSTNRGRCALGRRRVSHYRLPFSAFWSGKQTRRRCNTPHAGARAR